jgi:electron transport complex protein RnfD
VPDEPTPTLTPGDVQPEAQAPEMHDAPQLEHRMLVGAPTPHLHADSDTRRIMSDVVVALIPAVVLAPWFFGVRAALVIVTGVLAAELAEMVFKTMLGKKPTPIDGSATVTGLLLAMLLPATMPWYYVAFGAVVAMGIGKWAFGGLGQNPFNPALVGYFFLKVSFPARFAEPVANVLASRTTDAVTQATPLALYQGLRLGTGKMADIAALSKAQLFWGAKAGALGEVSAAALLLGGLYLLYRRVISWHAPVGFIGTVLALTGILWLVDASKFADPTFHLLAGGLMLGAWFMATDPSSTPITRKGRLAFGIGCGVMTTVIRSFGGFPEGVGFSILLMNAFSPAIDLWLVTPAVKQGRVERQKAAKEEKLAKKAAEASEAAAAKEAAGG